MRWASSAHLVLLEEFSNDSLWTHCECFYSSASVDHSSHVLTAQAARCVLRTPVETSKKALACRHFTLLNLARCRTFEFDDG